MSYVPKPVLPVAKGRPSVTSSRCHHFVDATECHDYDDNVRITDSARKHGIRDGDILHALDNPIRYREQEYDGQVRIFLIGPDRTGRFLELALVPHDEPTTIIHADILRPSHYDYL